MFGGLTEERAGPYGYLDLGQFMGRSNRPWHNQISICGV